MGVEPGQIYGENGEYTIERVIGVGGMGVVARAKDAHGALVALKILTRNTRADQPGLLDRFGREAEVLAALAHVPSVVGFQGRFRDPEHEDDVLILEYIEGRPLSELLGDANLPVDQVVEWMGHACHALNDMHIAGFVHRDLKPDNLMLVADPDTPIRVIDFNSAGPAGGAEGRLTRTQGAFPNTPAYLAPECFDGLPADRSADVYALGLTFAELLLGRHPLVQDEEPETQSEWRRAHDEIPLPSLEGLPVGLAEVLRDATAKRRRDRIPDAPALWTRLRTVWDGMNAPVQAVPPEPAASIVPVPRTRTEGPPRNWMPVAMLGLALLIGMPVLVTLGVGLMASLAETQSEVARLEKENEEKQAEILRRVQEIQEVTKPRAPPSRLDSLKSDEPADPSASGLTRKPLPSPTPIVRPPSEPHVAITPSKPTAWVLLNKVVHAPPIQFSTGKATIRDSSAVLAEVAKVIRANPSLGRVEIGVHSDSAGSTQMNLALTQSRADAVQRALVQQGVPGSRLTARGYGESKPISNNSTSEGRRRNRRTEFRGTP